MFPHRRPLPTFTLALSSLPKPDSLDGRRDSQRDIFSGYYTSLVVPRDLMRTVHPQSWNNCGFIIPPSNVFILEDELETETLFDDQDERLSVYSNSDCGIGWWRRITQIYHRLLRRNCRTH